MSSSGRGNNRIPLVCLGFVLTNILVLECLREPFCGLPVLHVLRSHENGHACQKRMYSNHLSLNQEGLSYGHLNAVQKNREASQQSLSHVVQTVMRNMRPLSNGQNYELSALFR